MVDSSKIIGRAPDQLSPAERAALRGRWIALEIYSPATLPLKRIEAVGENVAACAAEVARRGLKPSEFEYSLFRG